MPELAGLANGGTVFEAHRATSSYASGALGSMITGLTPREHGASDGDAALGAEVFTVAEAARQAGVMTAMFFDDLARSTEIKLETFRQRSFRQKLLEQGANLLSRIL